MKTSPKKSSRKRKNLKKTSPTQGFSNLSQYIQSSKKESLKTVKKEKSKQKSNPITDLSQITSKQKSNNHKIKSTKNKEDIQPPIKRKKSTSKPKKTEEKAIKTENNIEKTIEPTETSKSIKKKVKLLHSPEITKLKKEVQKQTKLKKVFLENVELDFGDYPLKNQYPRHSKESQKSYHLRLLKSENKIIRNLQDGLLLTVEYDGDLNKAFAKFYDFSDNKIKIWIDTTNHHPYCFHKDQKSTLEMNNNLISFPGYDGMETVKKYDLLADQEISVTKIYGKTPTDIGGSQGIKALLDGAWEANIRYHHSFIYDNNLIPGMRYKIVNGNVIPLDPQLDPSLDQKLHQVFQNEAPEIQAMADVYHPIFSSPIPSLKRMAFDIEVEDTEDGRLPDPTLSKYKVISVSFAATDGLRMVYCLDRTDLQEGTFPESFPKNVEVIFFKSEKDLIIETFRKIWEYPIVITFNGDNFDNSYLYHRARRLKIDETLNPILTSRGGGMVSRNTDYKQSLHLDIFQFFANRSIKGYAFGGAYLKNSLEDIASSLLGEGKVKHEGTLIGDMSLASLIHYNMMDSILTLELTTFNNNLMWNLLVVLMRVTRLPFQDLYRLQISAWIKSLLLTEHRRMNYLVPRMSELEERGGFNRSNAEKFQGAYVIDPVPGIHFKVAVLDFSSLYPTTIKTRNLSYETINCLHPECKKNKLPEINYWVCTKRMGIFAKVVGYLRDVRVNYFKPISNDPSISPKDRQAASVMTSALKVFINGAYGVFGSPNFNLYFRPVAEATTALGRYSIHQTIKKSESMDIKVLYGDTDSVFLLNPNETQVQELVKWSKADLDLDLELEKTYQFLGLSERKKNYIGVRTGGEQVDLKGLMVKKYNTPEFIKKKFKEVQDELVQITDLATFNQKKKKIIHIIRSTLKAIGKPPENGGFKIEDYAITVIIRREIRTYTKTSPQHVKAAKMLRGKELANLGPGSFISFVKTRSSEGVKPVSQASLDDIDVAKYKELVKSTFEQILDPLGINYQEIQGIKKLENFF
ncbi:MAG: DNA-directed DNA polymerase I [Promethearchaeia archaeon]|nr:MAG: DNA-directed DNA polymerase I [Candidatus Lokiarchaeia archaeon]